MPQHPRCCRSQAAKAHKVSAAPAETSEVHSVLCKAEVVIPLAAGIRGPNSPRSTGEVVATRHFAGSPAIKRQFLLFGPEKDGHDNRIICGLNWQA